MAIRFGHAELVTNLKGERKAVENYFNSSTIKNFVYDVSDEINSHNAFVGNIVNGKFEDECGIIGNNVVIYADFNEGNIYSGVIFKYGVDKKTYHIYEFNTVMNIFNDEIFIIHPYAIDEKSEKNLFLAIHITKHSISVLTNYDIVDNEIVYIDEPVIMLRTDSKSIDVLSTIAVFDENKTNDNRIITVSVDKHVKGSLSELYKDIIGFPHSIQCEIHIDKMDLFMYDSHDLMRHSDSNTLNEYIDYMKHEDMLGCNRCQIFENILCRSSSQFRLRYN